MRSTYIDYKPPTIPQVCRDLLAALAGSKSWLEEALLDSKEIFLGEDEERKEKVLLEREKSRTESRLPSRPEGASLLYVVTFCNSIFGSEEGLSHCRSQMISRVS